MAKTKLKTETIARDIKIKDLLGLKGYGNEPAVLEQPEIHRRSLQLGNWFNWYNYFCTNKEAKQFLVEYLTHTGDSAGARKLNKVSDGRVVTTYGWLARLSLRGLILTDQEKQRLLAETTRMIEAKDSDTFASLVEDTPVPESEPSEPKRNIQTVMRERAQEVGGELEGMLDEFMCSGAKIIPDTANQVLTMLQEKSILPQHVSIVLHPWNQVKQEMTELQRDTDEQLSEGYSHLTKTQIKNIIKLAEQVISNVNSYVALKQSAKATRVRKPVPVEKQVAKLKYLRKFSDAATKLELVSIDPTKLHKSSECWIYDTAKRKLYHYIADDVTKMLIVKGNTLVGFDTKESEAKILRKPAEQLKQVMGSKPAARKFFKDIKAVATQPNGRFNANMIILKAF
jgi:hypothetical protein